MRCTSRPPSGRSRDGRSGAGRRGLRARRAATARRCCDRTERATYQLASVVDDLELGITHVIRGSDHRPNLPVQQRIARALGGELPEVIHHGLMLGPDGKKLSKRHGHSSIAELRDEGFPAAAVRAYLVELDLPEHDVQLDLARLRRLAVDAIAAMPDAELAAAAGAPLEVVPALRGARSLVEAREYARLVLEPEPVTLGDGASLTLERFAELRKPAPEWLSSDEARAHRARAEGGRRRPPLAPARADGRPARPRACGRPRRALARRGARAHRLTTIAGDAPVRHDDALARRAAASTRSDRDLLVRTDRLPAHPRRQRLRRDGPTAVAEALARDEWLRDEARRQRHRHQRQDLRRRAGRERAARRRRDALVRRGHRSARARAAGRRADRGRDRLRPDRDDRAARRARLRVRVGRRRLLPRRAVPRVRPPERPAARPGRGAGAERAQGRSSRLRALEGEQARRGHVVGVALGPRSPGLAHRVLGHVGEAPRPGVRDPRRGARPRVPAPRERDRPVALARPAVRAHLDAQRDAALRRRGDAQVRRQRRLAEGRARPRGGARRCSCSSSPATGESRSTTRTRRSRRLRRAPRASARSSGERASLRRTEPGSGSRQRSRTTSTRPPRSRSMHEWRDHELLRRALAVFGLESLAEEEEAPDEVVALAEQRIEARVRRATSTRPTACGPRSRPRAGTCATRPAASGSCGADDPHPRARLRAKRRARALPRAAARVRDVGDGARGDPDPVARRWAASAGEARAAAVGGGGHA